MVFAQMDEQTSLLEQGLITNYVVELIFPVLLDYTQKLRQGHERRLVAGPKRQPALNLFLGFQACYIVAHILWDINPEDICSH
jgi:hypothetical protein